MIFRLFFILAFFQLISAQDERTAKLLPFQLIQFPNDVCSGSSRNGTCYTAEECSNKGGTTDGSCANGFGVCCVFKQSCGSTSNENCTYLVQSSSTSVSSPCVYTICPMSNSIARIRYDFTAFTLADQETGTTTAVATAATATDGSANGSCLDDAMSISTPGGFGSPVICGTNTGYHMILDADDGCQMVNFRIGASTGTSRQWDIKVTQYGMGNEDKAGPPGCLQYLTSTSGTIQNFGFSPSATTVGSTVTHLKNQKYDICIRRASGYCYICYNPSIIPSSASASAQVSFGLSLSAAAPAAQAQTANSCTEDYLEIPNGQTATIAAITTVAAGVNRYCGRFFSITSGATTSATVCTRQAPFRVGVNFNDREAATSAAKTMANANEKNGFPGGIVGFKLQYFQVSC